MAEVDAAVLKSVLAFLNKLRMTGLAITEAYIFGSYATGSAGKWSDIDVAVVSPQIGDDRFEERIRLTELAATVDVRLEPVPFNPESFAEENPFVRLIKREGVVVA